MKALEEQEFSFRDPSGMHVHMIGIGGSSMSGLSLMLKDMGCIVTGSNNTDNYLLDQVRSAGIPVKIGHQKENVHGADLVVYTAAVSASNPELQEAKNLGIPVMERAVLLSKLMRLKPLPTAVAGTHGKTTTTAMLAKVLIDCGKDPSVHVGGLADEIGGSVRIGTGDIFLSESCEFNRSFLHMRPFAEIILNIDRDHLDCYRDIDEIEETFGQFMSYVPKDGFVLGKGTDERIVNEMAKLSCHTYTFGLEENCTFHAENLTEDAMGYFCFDAFRSEEFLAHIDMSIPGPFNAENALAAFGAAILLGCEPQKAAESLSGFHGVHRRYEYTGEVNGAKLFHDYGHNPREMENALSIARRQCQKTLYAVVQPHTFSRVRSLFDEYLTCTKAADVTIVTDIYGARESDPGDLSSSMIVEGMRKNGLCAEYCATFEEAAKYLKEHLKPGDYAVTLGCGTINRLNEILNNHTEN